MRQSEIERDREKYKETERGRVNCQKIVKTMINAIGGPRGIMNKRMAQRVGI